MRISGLLLALLLSAIASAADGATVIDPAHYAIRLTDLGVGVNPTAINNVGQVAGDAAGAAFIWQSGVFTQLGTLGGPQSYANDLNDAGDVVGWSLDFAGLQKAFKWDNVATMVNIDPLTTFTSAAEAINIHNEIVGWKNNGSSNRSSWWTEADPHGFLAWGGGNHKAYGINNEGQVVGITLNADNSPDEGYFWNRIDPIDGFSGGLGSDYFPYAGVNNYGMTAGRDSVHYASLMEIGDSTSSSIGLLDASDVVSTILGLNDNGVFVGSSGTKAFTFDLSYGTMHDMNDFVKAGFEPDTIHRFTDINNSNTFVGVASINGVEHGIVGQFVPLLIGDYDLNHDVDAADYMPWQQAYGTNSVPYGGADGNGDGVVNAADYVVWRKNSGAMSAAGVGVPEPPAIVLLFNIVAVALTLRTRR